jgi:hypothetical protein
VHGHLEGRGLVMVRDRDALSGGDAELVLGCAEKTLKGLKRTDSEGVGCGAGCGGGVGGVAVGVRGRRSRVGDGVVEVDADTGVVNNLERRDETTSKERVAAKAGVSKKFWDSDSEHSFRTHP